MFEKIEDYWVGSDPDDVSGYLMDYLYEQMDNDPNRPSGVEIEFMSDAQIQSMIADDQQKVYEILINIRNALKAERQE